MPLRLAVSSAALRFQRFIHSSVIHRVDHTNHYDTLHVPQNASPGDIKQSFYSLSKTHHPDHNPNDPNAATRFVKISEAYAVLGHADRRQRYDRDVMKTSHESSIGRTTPRGSYASSGSAGGRPASGLSRRRTHFRGPPPSFYRSGGWGSQGAKRQAAQEEASSAAYTRSDGHQQGAMGGGMGPGQQPFGHGNDVPHFDREGHFRTHTNHERRRHSKRSESSVPVGPESSTLANFIFVGTVVSLGILIPSFLFERMTRSNKQEK